MWSRTARWQVKIERQGCCKELPIAGDSGAGEGKGPDYEKIKNKGKEGKEKRKWLLATM